MRHIGTVVTIALILLVMSAQSSMLHSVNELNSIAVKESADITKLQIQMLHMSDAQERQALGLKPYQMPPVKPLKDRANLFENPDVFIGGHTKHLPLNHSIVAKDN